MSSLFHVYHHIRKYGSKHKILYLGASLFFFWAIFDGIVSYAAPVLIEQTGVSHLAMGIIFASSSFFGGILDLILSEYLQTAHYRKVFFYMLLFSVITTVFLFQRSLFSLVVAMALWGIYYDLSTFSSYDFIARRIPKEEYASSFGIIDAFVSLAYVIAPLLTGLVLDDKLTWHPLGLSWFVLGVAFALYFVLISLTKKNKDLTRITEYKEKKSIWHLFHAWHGVFKDIGKPLLLRLLITMYFAFFGTIGPLYAEQLRTVHPLGGIFQSLIMFPALFAGWYVDGAIRILGKEHVAYTSYVFGCFVLLLLIFVNNPLFVGALMFVSSIGISIALPAVSGQFSDYIQQKPEREKTVESMVDFCMNAGFVIGPILAGGLAMKFSYLSTFALFGLIGTIVTLLLMNHSKI